MSEQAIGQAAQLMQAGRPAEAADVLRRSALAAPLTPQARRMLVQCLAQTGDLHAALDQQRRLVPGDIANADAQGRADTLAAARLAQMSMAYGDAAAWAKALVARDPADLEAAGLLATLVLWTDGPDAARDTLSGVMERDDAPPHMLMEALAYARDPSPALVRRVEILSRDPRLDAQNRANVLLALAQHHDRQGDADEAWRLADAGNALVPKGPSQEWRAVLDAHLAIYSADAPQSGADGTRHCYLVGTPRSGQSLFQSVLAAAPDVASLGERGALLQHLLMRTTDIARQPPSMRRDLYRQLAQSDARGIARQVGEPRWVVDKSPLHLPVAGSVALVHPTAVFGAVLRDPADTALSIWLRSFPPVYDYANDMGAILDHLGFALEALAAWREAGLDIRLFDHARLVAEPASVGRAVFDWLGLDWDEAYLAPENRTEPVATFSAAQVRRPISSREVRGAKAYARRLEPFADRIAALRDRTAELLGPT